MLTGACWWWPRSEICGVEQQRRQFDPCSSERSERSFCSLVLHLHLLPLDHRDFSNTMTLRLLCDIVQWQLDSDGTLVSSGVRILTCSSITHPEDPTPSRTGAMDLGYSVPLIFTALFVHLAVHVCKLRSIMIRRIMQRALCRCCHPRLRSLSRIPRLFTSTVLRRSVETRLSRYPPSRHSEFAASGEYMGQTTQPRRVRNT